MSETTAPTILVLGGSGFVGRSLCERLVRQYGGCARLTVPTRRLPHAQALQPLPSVTVLQADVHDDAQLRALVQEQDLVFNLIAILQGDEAAFERVHVALPRRLAEACAPETRLIHVSALGAAVDAPSRYLRSKARGEAALRAARPDTTVLRPSVIFGRDDSFLNLFARLQRLFPLLPLAGADARFQPVWVEDVAAALARCGADLGSAGQTYELAGPREWRLAELVRLAGRLSGHARPILPLPAALAQLQALALECLPGQPLMSRDNLASMQVPNVAGGALPGLAALGIAAQGVEAIAPTYLTGGATWLDRWRAQR
ncbi:MAG TPA: complex I NDUFA9 subunit family protein [Roseateles sp.]|nr:complex I NDUFA9 subunit family protein [Roseateles sp.]